MDAGFCLVAARAFERGELVLKEAPVLQCPDAQQETNMARLRAYLALPEEKRRVLREEFFDEAPEGASAEHHGGGAEEQLRLQSYRSWTSGGDLASTEGASGARDDTVADTAAATGGLESEHRVGAAEARQRSERI